MEQAGGQSVGRLPAVTVEWERTMSAGEDWALVARAGDGDMQAFGRLVQQYQVPVIHFCRRMLGSREDAEDVAQECFLRLYRHIGRLKPKAQFSTVLFQIARNLTLNFIRDGKRRGRETTDSLTRAEAKGRPAPDTMHRPDQSARLGEIERMVEQGLDALSPKHREVLVLRELQGLDYETIARIVRCRKGTVKSRLARAREQLHARLIEFGAEDL